MKRLLSLILVLLMTFSLLPLGALAVAEEPAEEAIEKGTEESLEEAEEATEEAVEETTEETEVPTEKSTEEAEVSVEESESESEEETAEFTVESYEKKTEESTEETVEEPTEEACLGLDGDSEIVDSGTCGYNLTWTLDSSGTLTINGTGAMENYSDGSAPWYNNYRDSITLVKIKSGATSIGNYAFYNCEALENIAIPDSVLGLGRASFYGCTSLAHIILSDNLTNIGREAFYGCTLLADIVIPDSVTSIGRGAFRNCKSLTDVVIPDGVTSIEGWLFCDCKALVRVVVPDSVTSIDAYAFAYCTLLADVTIPDAVTSIGLHAFDGCKALTSVTIPAGMKTIGAHSFPKCSSLTSVTIPVSVTCIDDYAFWQCFKLTDVYYAGSETEWDAVTIESHNSPITSASIHCNWGSGNTEILDMNLTDSQVGFYVYDVVTKAPCAGITVAVGGSCVKTGENGAVAMELTSGTHAITLSGEGYMTKTLEAKLARRELYTFSLVPSAGTPTVYMATLCKSSGKNTDILEKKVVLTEGSEEEYTLTVTAGYGGEIAEYRIIQEGKIVKKNETGVFTIKAEDFSVESAIYLQAVGIDGRHGDLCKTNLVVPDNVFDFSEDEYKIGLGKEVKIQLPSDVPFMGGEEISIDIASWPVYIELKDDKARVAVNFYSTDDDAPGIFQDDISWQGFIDAIEDNWDVDEYIKKHEDIMKKMKPGGGKPFSVSGASKSLEFKAWGYLEGSLDGEVSGTIKLALEGKIGNEWQTAIGPVPVVITLEFKGKAEGSLEGSFTFGDLSNTAVLTGEFAPSISLAVGAGPGFAEVASFTINGEGEIAYTARWNSDVGRYHRLTLTLGAFLKAKFLFLEYKWDFVKKTWVLIDGYESASTQALSLDGDVPVTYSFMDTDNYSLAGRDYLADTSPWQGDVVARGRSASAADTYTLLQSSIYEDTQLELVQTDDTVIAFFLTDDESRADVDRTMLVYTVYDAATGAWSEPAAVEDDGTADFYPSAWTDGESIYVVWSDMKDSVGDVEELDAEAIVSDIEISLGKYENGAFTVTTLTSDAYLDSIPAVCGECAAWIRSESNNMLGNDDKSVLCLYDGEKTATVATANVTELVLGKLGTQTVAALVTDGDGDYSTLDDRDLKLYDMSGSLLQTVVSGAVAEVAFAGGTLCWYEDGALRSIASADDEISSWNGFDGTIPGPWQTVEAGGRRYILFLGNVADELSDRTAVELFAYIQDNGTWSDAIQLTELGLHIQNFEAFESGGTVRAMLTVSELTEDNGTTYESVSLVAVTVPASANYALTAFQCDDVALADGAYVLDFEADVANIGSGDGEAYVLQLQYNGETVASLDCDGLKAGTDTTIEGCFTLDVCPEREGDYIVYLASADDPDETDNAISVTLGLDDLAVSLTDYSISDDYYVFSVAVQNNGLFDTDATLNIRLSGVEGDVILNDTKAISAGGRENFLVTLNAEDDIEYAASTLELWFEVCSEHKDSFAADNDDFFVLYRPDEYREHTQHVPEVTEGREATCTENGFTEGSHCAICGEVLVAQTAISATGHDYASVVTGPTCTEQGFTTHTCATCGDTYVDSYTPAQHTWDNGVVTKEPTDTETGVMTYTCTVCGETKTKEITAAPSHTPGDFTGDGQVTILDVLALLKHVAGISTITGNGDANSDGIVNILDVLQLLKYVAGIAGTTIY